MRKFGQAIYTLMRLLVTEGNTQLNAESLIIDLEEEILGEDKEAIQNYYSGDSQPLFDCINASQLSWMNDSKKLSLITDLS